MDLFEEVDYDRGKFTRRLRVVNGPEPGPILVLGTAQLQELHDDLMAGLNSPPAGVDPTALRAILCLVDGALEAASQAEFDGWAGRGRWPGVQRRLASGGCGGALGTSRCLPASVRRAVLFATGCRDGRAALTGLITRCAERSVLAGAGGSITRRSPQGSPAGASGPDPHG